MGRVIMICWLDIETTGLDRTQDRILEVAIIITENDLSSVGEGDDVHNYVLGMSPGSEERLAHNNVTRDMHTKTGLLDTCRERGITSASAELSIVQRMKDATKGFSGEDWYLGGSSVHFDRGFLDMWMPYLAGQLHHRILDVSSLKLFFDPLMPRPDIPNPEPHRAANDVIESLETARFYQQQVQVRTAGTEKAVEAGIFNPLEDF